MEKRNTAATSTTLLPVRMKSLFFMMFGAFWWAHGLPEPWDFRGYKKLEFSSQYLDQVAQFLGEIAGGREGLSDFGFDGGAKIAAVFAPVRLTVSIISPADWSSSLWSYALRRRGASPTLQYIGDDVAASVS